MESQRTETWKISKFLKNTLLLSSKNYESEGLLRIWSYRHQRRWDSSCTFFPTYPDRTTIEHQVPEWLRIIHELQLLRTLKFGSCGKHLYSGSPFGYTHGDLQIQSSHHYSHQFLARKQCIFHIPPTCGIYNEGGQCEILLTLPSTGHRTDRRGEEECSLLTASVRFIELLCRSDF